MRVVIDTNVLISGIFWTGKPKQVLNSARQKLIDAVTSKVLMNELEEILTREDKPFRLTKTEVNRVVKEILSFGTLIKPTSTISICQDDDDNRVLECAVSGNAEYIITGDPHLLKLKSYKNIKIVKPTEFLKIID